MAMATFPDVPLDIGVEIQLTGDGWTDITPYVYERDPITITRGQSADATTADPSTLGLTVNNRDSRFSPRAPAGAYYGKIGRNTPIRVSVDRPDTTSTVLDYPGAGDGVEATESAPGGLAITGDIDVRIDLAPRGPWPAHTCLISRYNTTGDQRGWLLWIETGGQLGFAWSTDGTSATTTQKLATGTIDTTAERLAIRVTLDVDNGASGSTLTFYTADTIDGPWTQLGAPVVTSGTTSVFDPDASMLIGAAGTTLNRFSGVVYGCELRAGIGGTVLAGVDWTTIDEGTTSFVDDSGDVTWTIHPGSAVILDGGGFRFTGEVSEWPVRWDSTGTDVYATVTAAGVLRRLQQGTTPVRSTLTRIQSIKPTMRAYWPCEEGEDSTQIASGIGGPPMSFSGTNLPGFASYSGFHCSNPIPSLNDAEWIGSVPPYSDTGEIALRFLMSIPSDTQATANQSIIAVATSGSAAMWHLSYQADGALRLEAFASAAETATPIFTTGPVSFGLLGKDVRGYVLLTQDGANVTATVAVYPIGAAAGSVFTGTASSTDIGRATSVIVNNGGGIEDISVGQIAVEDKVNSIFDDLDSINAFAGERAGRRFLRLAGENGVYARCYGSPDDTARMGPQDPDTLVALLNQCVATDDGLMFEPRDVVGVAMRTRSSMQNRDAAVTLDYRTDLAGDIEPTDDDRYVVNDVTVTRTGGSSTEVEDTTGPLNVSDPPDGVGRYTSEFDLSLFRDLDTIDQAWWHLHRGTTDEPRYPTLTVDMSRRDITGNPTVQAELAAADIGDRLTVTNPPAWLPPGTIEQVIGGVTETLSTYTRTHAYALSPYDPYVIAVYDQARYDTAGSELAAGIDADATTITVATTTGPEWTTDPADFPLDITIGGERMTITAAAAPAGTEISVVGVTFAVTPSSGGEILTVDMPDGVVDGDVLYVWEYSWTVNDALLTEGWTPAGAIALNGGITGLLYWRRATLADETAGSLTLTFDGGNPVAAVALVAVHGAVATGTPHRTVRTDVAVDPVTTINGPAAADAQPGDLVLQLLGTGWDFDDGTDDITGVSSPWAIAAQFSSHVEDSILTGGYPALAVATATAETSTATWTMAPAGWPNVASFAIRGVQQFIVTRSVDGVVKPHPAGADVRLYQPAIRAL